MVRHVHKSLTVLLFMVLRRETAIGSIARKKNFIFLNWLREPNGKTKRIA